MFYCEPCRVARHWPKSPVGSRGRCECCGQPAFCYDTPSFLLPDPSDRAARDAMPVAVTFDHDDEAILAALVKKEA